MIGNREERGVARAGQSVIHVRSGEQLTLAVVGSQFHQRLPQALDPASGLIVNANNRVTAAGDPLVAAHWPEAYRARRILTALGGASAALTVDDLAKLQTDTLSVAAAEMLPLLLPHVTPRGDADKALLASMQTWDGTMDRDRPEPLIFAVDASHPASTQGRYAMRVFRGRTAPWRPERVYSVKAGETLQGIARACHVTPRSIPVFRCRSGSRPGFPEPLAGLGAQAVGADAGR